MITEDSKLYVLHKKILLREKNVISVYILIVALGIFLDVPPVCPSQKSTYMKSTPLDCITESLKALYLLQNEDVV